MRASFNGSGSTDDQAHWQMAARLQCWPRVGGQPTYGDLFAFVQANAARLTESVVVSNGDVVFGRTLRALHPMVPGVMHTLSVNGGPETVPELYCSAMGLNASQCRTENLCLPIATGMLFCRVTSESERGMVLTWDAYAFNTRSFDLPSITMTLAPLDFYMNIMNAENNAACQLLAAGWRLVNNCTTVRVVHFHCAPKMHHGRTGGMRRFKALRKVCGTHLPFNHGGFIPAAIPPAWVLHPEQASLL
jgi:hypothetical protein